MFGFSVCSGHQGVTLSSPVETIHRQLPGYYYLLCLLSWMSPSQQDSYVDPSGDIRRRAQAADGLTESSALPFRYLLWLPPTRRAILDNISAFEVAKLVHLKLCILNPKEKARYLKPLRDLVWDVPAVEKLSQDGMRLTLLGDGAYALEQRLHETDRYLDTHGNGKLAIYLLGTFPISAPTATALDPLINFSTTGHSSPMRSYGDKYQLRRICALTNTDAERVFVMSFSAPMQASTSPVKGSWYKIDDVPDYTLDLWVYVPSFRDRLREEVRLTPQDLLRIARASPLPVLPRVAPGTRAIGTCVGRRFFRIAFDVLVRTLGRMSALGQMFTLCTRHHRLKKWSLTAAGVHAAEATHLAQPPAEESSVRRLLTNLGMFASSIGLASGLRTVVGPTDAPKLRIFLDITNYSTLGWRIPVS
ncbi:hypothetical protein AALT_g11068 [Alternaria alternata]|nr:hypothetical protein AALT_g11068 [Alternaria alternata]